MVSDKILKKIKQRAGIELNMIESNLVVCVAVFKRVVHKAFQRRGSLKQRLHQIQKTWGENKVGYLRNRVLIRQRGELEKIR